MCNYGETQGAQEVQKNTVGRYSMEGNLRKGPPGGSQGTIFFTSKILSQKIIRVYVGRFVGYYGRKGDYWLQNRYLGL